ncbi:hypothetical protein RSAG8_10101, partial [Rhizoctonia solani AG-8 WAC10335]
MSRSSRSRLDSRSRSPENIRKNPEPLLKKGSADEALPWPSQYSTNFSSSNKSETNAHPRPSTPEEWLDFAQRTIWEAATAADAIQVLVAEPDVLEFLITANEDIRDLVYESVCGASFPTKRARWASSISCYFFRRFQVYLSRLPPDLADRTIDDASRQISALVGALSALDHITFEHDGAQEEGEPEDAFFKVKSKKSQKQRKANKASRARTNTVLADPRLFMAVDMDVPVTSDEAMVAEICILERIQETLEVLLTAFENPNLAPHAKALFFKQPLQYVPARLAPEPNTLVEDKTSTVAESEVGAYPHIRPLAAAKYFDEGTGLGAWNIIISGRAVKDLRHIQKDGSHVFGMVYKKIMELSQGFFSDDNQKRLLGLDTEVPIYEAKVSRDLRIVYQVDLDTDIDAKVDKQSKASWACLHRETPRARGQNVTLPGHFKHEEGMEAPVEPPPTNSAPLEGMTEQDFLDLHSLIALEKFIPMSQSLVTSILNNSDANHVFHVSAKEKEIIYHESACFVLGRSGTGKTTSILFKMIGIEKLFEQMEGVAKPRQVFVTQSRVLAQRVQEYYQSLVRSSSGTVNSDSREDEQDEEVLADLDDEDASTFGLPTKYSMLEDKHFPMFVTYDQLCSLLEADFGFQFRRSARTKVHAAAEKRFAIAEVADVKIDLDREVEVEIESSATEVVSPTDIKEELQQAQRAAVTFEIFVAAYWPHFDFRLTKGFDPALVYSEFLGIIQGSELALQSSTGALSRDEYAGLSHRKSSFASQRDRVYDLYELYRKRKKFLGGYDSAERTHALVHALHLGEQDEAVRCGKRSAIHPALFHLAVNYRSHGGIVDCASSVVELISDLFPYSIDKLSKETGLIDGPKPLFFSGWDRDVVRFEQFLQGEADTRIDFGASQVILVRNDAARAALRAQVGEIGLILTLYESKGLEFDDVLLYNFFEDSVPSASTWRVILHGLEGARLGAIPRFDEIRHAVICIELKNLYVGLTRARNHCWIWDVSDKAEPMKLFWQEKGLISLCGPEDPMPQFVFSSSEADWAKSGRLLFNKGLYPQAVFCFEKAGLLVERDIASAYQQGSNLSFPQAVFCFEKAGLLVERDIASAYQARKDARLLLVKSVDRQTRRGAFKRAANDFLGCAFLSKGKQQISCYLRAAECFIQAEEWKLAAESYLSAEQFDLSARNFRRAGCFDQAVQIVKKYRNRLKSQDLVDEILGIARLEFLRKSEYQKASELFEDLEEQLEYMEDFGFDAARIHVLELNGRFTDAAAVALQERNTLEGVRLLLLSNQDNHKLQAVKYAVHGLWTLLPYGAFVTPDNENSIGELLRQLATTEPKLLSKDEQRGLDLFRAIHAKNLDRILALSRSNALLARAPEALLGFAHCSKFLTTLQQASLDDFNTKSILALSYYNGLIQLSRTIKIPSVETQRLLGFEPVAANPTSKPDTDNPEASEFWIYSSSRLFEPAKRLPGSPEPVPLALGLSALVIPESALQRLIIDTVTKRLNNEVWTMTSVTTSLHALRLCLDFAVFGKCTRPGCGRQEVSSIRTTDQDRQKYFNLRVRAHVLQALIVQAFHPQSPEDERQRRNNIRIWMQKMHETLFPHFPPSGNVLCADPTLVPELNRAADLSPVNRVNRPFFLSEVLLALQIGYRVQRNIFEGYVSKLHSCELVRSESTMIPPHYERSIVHDLVDYYGEQTENALQGALVAVRHIINRSLNIELNVLIHLLESIGRDIIIHGRALALYPTDISGPDRSQVWADMRDKALDGLVVPRSWALDIVQKRAKQAQMGWEVLPFLDVLYEVLRRLKFEEDPAFYLFNGRMGIILRGIMSIRVCRLLYLIGENLVYHPQHKNKIRVSIANALVPTTQGSIHVQLCGRFSRTASWPDLFSALAEGPLNRGADELIRLFFRHSKSRHRRLMNVRTITYEHIKPELERALSFVTLNAPRGPALNPEAKPFVLNQRSKDETAQADAQDAGDYKDEDELPEGETDDAPGDIFGGLVPAQLAFRIPAAAKPERKFTEDERKAGLRILEFYRKLVSRGGHSNTLSGAHGPEASETRVEY